MIFSSFYGSLGNLLHTSSKRQSKEVFESLLYFGYFLGCITSACFLGVFQDFIIIFFGSNYLLSYATMLVIVGNYYLSCICQPIWTFRETSGLFSKVKYIMGITAIINLVLSIFLGYCWGIFGILLASAISRLLTYFWYEPKLIYQDFFQSSVSQYFSFILKYFIISILAILPAIFMSRFYNNSLLVLLLKLFTSGFCSVFIFILLTKENESFKKMKSIVLKKLRNKI